MPNEESVSSVATYDIKTDKGTFSIKAPKKMPIHQVLSSAAAVNPKFAEVYPAIQAHKKFQELGKQMQTHDTQNPIEKDPIYKDLKKQSQAQAYTPQEVEAAPSWYGRSAKYLGGELVGAGDAVIGAAAGGYKMLHDVVSAIDPTDRRPYADRVNDLKEDVKGAGAAAKTPFELGSTIMKVLRDHPEAAADPQKFGEKVANGAMVTHGGVKMAESLAKSANLAPDQIAEARRVANNLTGGKGSIFAQTKALEDAYVHTKGLDIAKKFSNAAKAIDTEVKTHSKALSEQIDKGVPGGVIDAGVEAKKIADTFADVVKTPDSFNPALKQAFKDAVATAPGQWSFEKARQFRSSIGRAMSKESGPQRAVLTQVYTDLTNKLGATAKKYGMESSWNHYNTLERKYSQQYSDIVDQVRNAQTGKEVAAALSKNTAFTGELTKELEKYGLKRQDVLKYISDANRISRNQGKYGSLFRLAYGTPLGLAGVIAGHAVGGGWLGSMAAGATLGYASSGLINLARSLKLNPDIIETILKDRELPGKMPADTGSFPTTPSSAQSSSASTPQLPKAKVLGTTLNSPKRDYTKPAIQPQGVAPKEKQLAISAPQPQEKPKVVPQATPAQNSPAAPAPNAASPTVVPSGQHGTGRLGKLAKKAENQARYRETGQDKTALEKRNVAKQTQDAMQKAQATSIDVNQYGVPELEDALKERGVKFAGPLKWYRANPTQIEEYKEALKWILLEHLEKSSAE